MAKTFVTDVAEQTRVPFLRGILTRSLQDLGLAFVDAYELASAMRLELADVSEISTGELRDRVAIHLAATHGAALSERYRTPAPAGESILVRDIDAHTTPFSRSRHQRSLQSCGLSGDEARPITMKIYQHLVKRGITTITSNRLGYLTYRCLERDIGKKIARRYLVWVQFVRSGRSLLLILGGTVGCGKSTVATEVAHSFEIVRVQSTDMLREVMRIMVPERLMPVLFTSSFTAWQALPLPPDSRTADDVLVAEGYKSQAELVSLPCEAVVKRALRERVSLILEGVHVEPAFMERLPKGTDAIIVPVMLAVLNQRQLKNRIRGRGTAVPERRAERYLNNFDAIWRLQTFLLSEADRHHIPIIANDDKDTAIRHVLSTIVGALARHFTGNAREVFRTDAARLARTGVSSGQTGRDLEV